MALDRWDPLREMMTLREAMDRLFQESVVRPTGSFLAGARGATPVDIAERDNSFVVQAAMPGIAPEEIQVTVKGNTLTIRGEHKDEEERSDQNWLVRERRGQSFYRSVTLPTAVNADKAEAKYENGVLTLTLPKADEALPKQIRIGGQVGSETGQPAIQMPGDRRLARRSKTMSAARPSSPSLPVIRPRGRLSGRRPHPHPERGARACTSARNLMAPFGACRRVVARRRHRGSAENVILYGAD